MASILVGYIPAIIIEIFAILTFINIIKNRGGTSWIVIGIFNIIFLLVPILNLMWSLPAIILIIVWWANKSNRLERLKEKKELRKLQLETLKKSKSKTELKGNMRKLK